MRERKPNELDESTNIAHPIVVAAHVGVARLYPTDAAADPARHFLFHHGPAVVAPVGRRPGHPAPISLRGDSYQPLWTGAGSVRDVCRFNTGAGGSADTGGSGGGVRGHDHGLRDGEPESQAVS